MRARPSGLVGTPARPPRISAVARLLGSSGRRGICA